MAYVNITNLPTEPKRSDPTDVFVTNADAWVAALATFVAETNAGGGAINTISTQVTDDLALTNADAVSTGDDLTNTNSDVIYAKEWAAAIEDTPVSVAAGGDGSTTYSSGHHAAKSEASHQSALAAAAAAGAAGGLPSLTGNAGKVLSVNANADGVEWASFDTIAIEANIALNSFNIAVNGGLSVQNMVDGVSDVFADEGGIDTGRSVDEAYDGVNDLYTLADDALHTNTSTALASPDNGLVVIQQEDVSAVTLNTDLSAWVSRTALDTYTTDFATNNKLNATAHGFSNNDRVILSSSTGTNFPTGLNGVTVYYVVSAASNDFEVSLTSGGAAVSITSDGSGTKNVSDYSQATLTEETTVTTGRILTGNADLSGQAAGTTISTVLIADNTKTMKIHALSTQWK